MKHHLVLSTLCALLLSTGATAQAKEAPLGQIVAITGSVSVGVNNFISQAAVGTPLYAGTNVLVSSHGKASVAIGKDCFVQLGASQYLSITPGLPCAQQQASVKQLFAPYQVAQTGPTAAPPSGAAISPNTVDNFLATGEVAAAPLLPLLGLGAGVGFGAGVVGIGAAINQRAKGSSGS
jgi:hypothetical protein